MPNSEVVVKLSFLNQTTLFKHPPSSPPPSGFCADSLCVLNDFQNKKRLFSINIIHLSAFVIKIKWAFSKLWNDFLKIMYKTSGLASLNDFALP